MRILFTCHRLPYPPKRGGKIRPFNIIRHLTESGHEVTVASLSRSEEEYEEGSGLTDYCDRLLVGHVGELSSTAQMLIRLPTLSPSSMGYFYSGYLHRRVEQELREREYDLVFVHCSSAAQYARTASGIPSILDFGDMDSAKWLDYSTFKRQPLATGYWLEGTKLRRAEKLLASRFDMCTCTTKAELETLESLHAADRTDWFPNGVDSEYFAPASAPYEPDAICFVGRMDYYPNQQAVLHFCRDILPLIQHERPHATFTVVGAEPSREVLQLASLPGVRVTGTVDDVRPYVHSATLTVAPLFIARGTQNKILESMAMGVPVVSSAAAAGGVDAIDGEHLLVADDPASFARTVLEVLRDTSMRDRLASKGRERILSHHNWAQSMRRVDEIVCAVGGKV